MVTLEKLAIYRKYNGDIDSWVRCNIKSDTNIMDDADWYLISRLLSDLVLVENNLASDDLKNKAIQFIQHNTESEVVIELLKEELVKDTHSFKSITGNSNYIYFAWCVVIWILGFLFIKLIERLFIQ
ncbi:hypothetical protein [Hymenobacter sp. DG01]|uniref:hypothetical protein n=1 Tax=Hymenobacter sp. DG01 TaxID=2584940 RepID=UPI001121C717|nr:hypothetical protein [Hymenobacter sp. DG01]